MGMLTADMRRVVEEQRLGFVATVCPDGTPNLSPKGTTGVWDDDHLVFRDIPPPRTVANLRLNPVLEINVVDPFLRKGYRFKGHATVLTSGVLFDEICAFYQLRGVTSPINAVILVAVERALPVTSPVYDLGASETEVARRWEERYGTIKTAREATGGRD